MQNFFVNNSKKKKSVSRLLNNNIKGMWKNMCIHTFYYIATLHIFVFTPQQPVYSWLLSGKQKLEQAKNKRKQTNCLLFSLSTPVVDCVKGHQIHILSVFFVLFAAILYPQLKPFLFGMYLI